MSLAGNRRRLARLEARAGGGGTEPPLSPLAQEVREIDRHIRELDAEIREIEAQMTPEELAEARREVEAREARLRGLSLDEEIAASGAEIAALNAEGGGG